MPRFTAEELALRARRIGSSDIPKIAGVDPMGSGLDVVLEKRGLSERGGETVQQRLGHDLEETIVAPWYAAQTGCELAVVPTLVHPAKPWLTASPDRLVVGRPRALEAKNVGHRMLHYWQIPGERGQYQVPPYVVVQVTWQGLAIRALGRDHEGADVAALLGGRDFEVFFVPYDEELAESLLAIGERFAEDFILRDDADPPIEGPGASAWLKRRYPSHSADLLPASEDADVLCARLAAIKAMKRVVEHEEERIEVALKAIIGEAAGIKGPLATATWKAPRPTLVTDWQAALGCALDTLRAAGIDAPTLDETIQTYSAPRAASRRFLLTPNARGKEAARALVASGQLAGLLLAPAPPEEGQGDAP